MLASWSILPELVERWQSLLVAVSWQLAALALLGWLCERALRLRPARVRHALWWFVLAAPLLLAPGREALQRRQAVVRVPAPRAAARVVALAAPLRVTPPRIELSPQTAPPPAPASRALRPPLDLADGLALVWLLGCGVLALRLVVGHRRVRRLLARSEPVAGTAAWDVLSALCARAGTGVVSLRVSADVHSPVLYGWRRPVILFPESWLSALSDGELRAMLAHEAAHVRRRDFLANSLQRVLEIPMFFHPGAWLASRRIALAREELCDAWALTAGTEASSYARWLAAAAERAQGVLAPVSLGVAESRFTLLRRVEAVLTRDRVRRASRPLLIGLALLGLLSAAAFAAVQVCSDAPVPASAAQGASVNVQEMGREARRMEAELRPLATAILSYVQDNGGQFPQASNFDELRRALASYLGGYQPPKDKVQYVLPAGIRVGAIETPAVTPMLIIDTRSDFSVVAYADGHLDDESKGPRSPHVVDLTVIDESGKPAAGATVRSLRGGVGGRTGENGRLSGLKIDARDSVFYVTSADGTQDDLPAVFFGPARAEQKVTLHRKGGPADMVQLSGRVLDPAGRPVAGADVWMRGFTAMGDQQDTFVSRDIGKTDAQGRFSVTVPRLTVGHQFFISGWQDPWECQVIAHRPGLGTGWVKTDGSAQIEGLEITLAKPASLHGQVTDAEGKLLPGVPVGVGDLTAPGRPKSQSALKSLGIAAVPPWLTTRTDRQGRFALSDLPADASVKLDITTCGAGPSYRAGEIAPELGEIKLAEQRGELLVRLRKQPLIEGVLLTPDKKPAAGVKVMLAGWLSDRQNATTSESAVTDKDGRYEFSMSVGGTWTIWVSDPKYFAVLLKDRKVELGQHVTIPTTVLQRSASIRGRVLDARTGAPIANVPVMSIPRGDVGIPDMPTNEAGVTTGPDGRFEVGGAPGKVLLNLAGPPAGYTWSYRAERETVGGTRHVKVSEDPQKPSSRLLQVKSGQALRNVDLYLMPEATVTGEVLGPDGRPWQGKGLERGGYVSGDLDRTLVTSTVYPPLGSSLRPDGTFRIRYFFSGVPAVLMVVDEPDGLGGAARLTPELGRDNHVTIRMSPLARVTGRVLMPGGSPAVGVYLASAGQGGVATTDKGGRFTANRGIVGLPATVTAYLPGPFSKPGQQSSPPKYRGESKQFEVQPGQQEVDIGDIILKPYRPPKAPNF